MRKLELCICVGKYKVCIVCFVGEEFGNLLLIFMYNFIFRKYVSWVLVEYVFFLYFD